MILRVINYFERLNLKSMISYLLMKKRIYSIDYNSKKKFIVVVGPESTGTRYCGYWISQNIVGHGKEYPDHADIYSAVWYELAKGQTKRARRLLMKLNTSDVNLTRISYPGQHGSETRIKHAQAFGKEPLADFLKLVASMGYEPIVFVTNRDKSKTVKSSHQKRSSTLGSVMIATANYEIALKQIYGTLAGSNIAYRTFDLEDLVSLPEEETTRMRNFLTQRNVNITEDIYIYQPNALRF